MARRTLTRSVTLRLRPALQSRLTRRAKEVGTTPSELIRSILEQELATQDAGDAPTLYDLTREFVGSVSSTRIVDGRDARRALEKWNPDRRG